jgi:hypothetical protein
MPSPALLHGLKGVRGFGLPAPHGLQCTCGEVVPMEDWHHHLHGVPEVRIVREGELWVGWNGEWTEALMFQAFDYFYDRFGKAPRQAMMTYDAIRSLTSSLRSLSRYAPLLRSAGVGPSLHFGSLPIETLYMKDPSLLDHLIIV